MTIVLPKDLDGLGDPDERTLFDSTLVYNGYVLGGTVDGDLVKKSLSDDGKITESAAHSSRKYLGFSLHLPEIEVSSRVIYDRSGRKPENYEYTINFRTFLLRRTTSSGGYIGNQNHDQDVQGIINILSDTSDSVIFPHGLGGKEIFGDIHTVRPQGVRISPTGMAGSLKLEWSLVVLASNSNFKDRWENYNALSPNAYDPEDRKKSIANPTYNIKSLTWGVSHSLDSGGLVTRVISGRVTTFASRGRDIHADWLRRSISVLRPDMFRPVSQDFTVSEDKTTMVFTIVDQEFRGTPYPPGLEFADGSFSLSVNELLASRQGSCSFSVMFKILPGYSHDTANYHFFLAVARAQQTIIDQLPPAAEQETGSNWALIPQTIRIDRGLWESSRIWRASITWTLIGCIKDLFFNSTFWNPIQEYDNDGVAKPVATSAAEWRVTANAAGATDTWGHSGYMSSPDDDYKQDNEVNENQVNISQYVGGESSFSGAQFSGSAWSYVNPEITAENSWLNYDISIKATTGQTLSKHKKAISYIPTPDSGYPSTASQDATVNYIMPITMTGVSTGMPVVVPAEGTGDPLVANDTDELRGTPTTYIQVNYVGVRVKYNPENEAPKLKTLIEGVVPTHIKTQADAREIGTLAGQPVYMVKQRSLYSVDSPVDRIKSYSHLKTSLCMDFNPEYETRDGDQ